jgi:1,4-dihydroxy-2-naphthoate octaprenyltransferase
MSRASHWIRTIRPKTLSLSVAPVLAGTTLAWKESGEFYPMIALAAMLAAILIQIGTNLYNDAADFERGADTAGRAGPARAAAEGWFTPGEIKRAALLSFALAFLIGIYLALHGGWPVVIIGLLSLTAGYAYTGGPRPIAYTMTGELFVFLFFGLTAVLGSYYLHAFTLSWASLLSACAIGLLAAGVLLVNNYRDLETDREAKKLTLAHQLGRTNSKRAYALFMLTPFVLPLLMPGGPGQNWLILLCLPPAIYLVNRFYTLQPGKAFNPILANTAKLQLAYALLYSIGLITLAA